MKASLSLAEARRIALGAQGFGQDRNKSVTWAGMARELKRLHLLQIDSVNVLVRSHYMPLFSRLGSYSQETLDKRSLNQSNRALFECWAHEASLVRMELYPLMRWRMERAKNGEGIYRQMANFAREEKTFLKNTLAFVEKNGPIAQSDLPGQHKGAGGWWGWSKGKLALETLFARGELTTSHRNGFERFYDLSERVIAPAIFDATAPEQRDAVRELTRLSTEALGVGTPFDLRDYFRLPVAEARQGLQDCLDTGDIEQVAVDGWKAPAFVPKGLKIPRSAGGTCLVSPFDPIVWDRDRAERLFNFHYRIELYTPELKRKFGYYVLPFLHQGAFAGRLCLKADRATSTLRVNTCHSEEGVEKNETAEAMAQELRRMAEWLGMENVFVSGKGDLAKALSRTLGAGGRT
jgi:uncharacterized protein